MREEAKTPAPKVANPRLPRHVAIIMDGNGRWAAERGMPRAQGHRAGVEAVRRSVRMIAKRGIPYLTLFSFSSENWIRPQSEISALFALLRRFIRNDLAELHRDGVRIRIIGRRDDKIPGDILRMLDEAEALTRDNTAFNLIIAFNYGARAEIADAARKAAQAVQRGELSPEDIDESRLEDFLYTNGIPDPDLLVRTSGEARISNFLLWQCAYSEFVFLPVYWPDFDEKALDDALNEYAARDRRFGGVEARA